MDKTLLKAFLLVVIAVPFTRTASKLPEWHMKPLGSHIKPDKVDETFAHDLISPEDFAEKYVLPRKPIVFRDIVKTWPAYKLWTDDYLKEHYGDMEMRLEGKKEKASTMPKGDVCLGRDRLKTFLNEYRKGANKYVVSDLPTPMWHEVNVPPSMACGEFLTNYVEIDIWINSDMGKKGNGGNSLLHKDAFNTVNCVINGTKEWKLIDLKYNDYIYQSWEGPMDAGYGGFSIINVDKVSAKEFPNVGKIPRWQFVTVNAGDCIHLPSQMWHQVKSYGESNRAVAFLFSQFIDKKHLNVSDCPKNPTLLPLSDVDVDLQYPGTGLMTMGNSQISDIRDVLDRLVSNKKGYVTKRRTFRVVYSGHASGAKNKELMLQKAKDLYQYFLDLAGGNKEAMTHEFLNNITRNQVRPVYKWLFPIEPANSYDHEYSVLEPDEITEMLEYIQVKGKGIIEKEVFIDVYQKKGGTLKFAEDFWQRLAGDKPIVKDIKKTLEHALHKYELNRRNDPHAFDVDDEATITTPQGHKSQPKKNVGGYTNEEEQTEEIEERGPEEGEKNQDPNEGTQFEEEEKEIPEEDIPPEFESEKTPSDGFIDIDAPESVSKGKSGSVEETISPRDEL